MYSCNIYRVAQKNGASLSHCKYSENSMAELHGNWWTYAITTVAGVKRSSTSVCLSVIRTIASDDCRTIVHTTIVPDCFWPIVYPLSTDHFQAELNTILCH